MLLNLLEVTKIYEYCLNNSRQVDGTIDYMLLKIGMFGSYEITSNYSSDSDSLFILFY